MNTQSTTTSKKGSQVLATLSSTWYSRAGVKKDRLDYEKNFNPLIPDFPVSLVPFKNHALFEKATDVVKHQIYAGAWVWYNEKTIAIEEAVVNPACQLILQEAFPSINDEYSKQTLAQTILDEQFHIFMCLDIANFSRKKRNIEPLRFDTFFLVKKKEEIIAEYNTEWERNIIHVAFMLVAELTINAFLRLLSDDKTIQPVNQIVTEIHRLDELSHSKIVREILASIYQSFTDVQKDFFLKQIPKALNVFKTVEWEPWEKILAYSGFNQKQIRELIEAGKQKGPDSRLFRDFSSLKTFASEINVLNKLDIDL